MRRLISDVVFCGVAGCLLLLGLGAARGRLDAAESPTTTLSVEVKDNELVWEVDTRGGPRDFIVVTSMLPTPSKGYGVENIGPVARNGKARRSGPGLLSLFSPSRGHETFVRGREAELAAWG